MNLWVNQATRDIHTALNQRGDLATALTGPNIPHRLLLQLPVVELVISADKRAQSGGVILSLQLKSP
jgi:hypothetical protein